MINVALIGISGFARVHLRMLHEWERRGRVRLVAATVPNAEEEAALCAELRERGVVLYPEYSMMLHALAGRIDLCMIPTPINLHARMAIAAIEAGAHVFVEKPLAGNLIDGLAMIEAADRAGKMLAVGFQEVYSETNRRLKQALLAGHIGRVKSIRGMAIWPRGADYYRRNNWAGRISNEDGLVLDSPVNNALAHFIHLMLFWAAGEMDRVSLLERFEVETYRAHDIETYDTACLKGTSDTGIEIVFGCSHAGAQAEGPRLIIEGTHGHIEWIKHSEDAYSVQGDPPLDFTACSMSEIREGMMRNLLDRIAGGSSPICDGRMAVVHTALVDEIWRHSPVHTVPPEHLAGPGTKREIIDIGRHIKRVVDERKLLGELGVPWGQPAASCSMSAAALS